MKKAILISICVASSVFCKAQTFQEWFYQKKTQVKYLVEQIAAFQVYTGYVEKGYSIASNGLGTIRSLKKGDFNLHSDYFNSLKQVSPAVKRYGRVADIMAMQASILKLSRSALQAARKSDMLTGEDVAYLNKVHEHLLGESATNIDLLLQLITGGKLEMKGDERIVRIDKLYEEVKDQYAFLQSFSDESAVLVTQRIKEQQEVNASRKIYGIQ